MSQDQSVHISTVKACKKGWVLHEDVEQKISNDRRQPLKQNDEKRTDVDVHVIDWHEVILCNSMGFSRLIRHCDDKSLNILINPTLFSENSEKHHIVTNSDSFMEITRIKKTFEGSTVTEIRKCAYGLPDSLFLTQIFNEEKYDSIPNDKKTEQIFSARGIFTTSLYTKKLIPKFSMFSDGYWTFCRCCDTTFDFSTHSPGDYKNILINSKLLCIIAFDTQVSPQFHLSFRRLTGGYSRRFRSELIEPYSNGQLEHSNVNITEFGISLRNRDVFGVERTPKIETTEGTRRRRRTERGAEARRARALAEKPCETYRSDQISDYTSVSLADLSGVVFDCVLLDNEYDSNNNIILTLLLICKSLPHVKHCFEFVKIKVVFSNGYENLLSCWCQRDTNVAINNNSNIKKMFNLKNECVLGWNNKTASFKTECVKIGSNRVDGNKSPKFGSVIKHNRLLIMVIKTASHHIILYNCDLNNYVILKLNTIVNVNSNKIFPWVCATHSLYIAFCLCLHKLFCFFCFFVLLFCYKWLREHRSRILFCFVFLSVVLFCLFFCLLFFCDLRACLSDHSWRCFVVTLFVIYCIGLCVMLLSIFCLDIFLSFSFFFCGVFFDV